jgi:hypothetical protein
MIEPVRFGAVVTTALSGRKITALTSVPKGLLAVPDVFSLGESIRLGLDLMRNPQ